MIDLQASHRAVTERKPMLQWLWQTHADGVMFFNFS